MAVNKCNITAVALEYINIVRYGFTCKPNTKYFLENYIQYLGCATVKHDICHPDVCVNNPIVITYPVIYWGWKDDNTVLTVNQIEASPNFKSVQPGQPIVVDYRSNTDPKFLWVAIGVSHPIMTEWYGQPFNQGEIGTDQDFVDAPTLVGNKYNFYITNYPSQQNETEIEYRP